MPRYASMKCKQLISILLHSGYTLLRSSGSHKIFVRGNHTLCVADHGNGEFGPRMVAHILKQANISL